MNRRRVALVTTFVVLFLTAACGRSSLSGGQTPAAETPQLGTAVPTTQPLALPTDDLNPPPPETPGLETPNAPEVGATPLAGSPITPGVYPLNQQTTSETGALARIHLILHRATVTGDSLILRVAFQNSRDEGYILSGSGSASAFRLYDAAGNEYQPTGYSENLQRIAPPGNFGAGQANAGDLAFPIPIGPAPYELRFPAYAALIFELGQPTIIAPPVIPQGVYALNVELYTDQRALAPIRLRLEQVTVTAQELIFDLSFVNTRRQGYDLLLGPRGGDGLLLDAENVAYAPISVSDNLSNGIAPEGGWLAGQAHAGQLVFPRPERMERARFVFPQYAAAELEFGAAGLSGAVLTSASGGPPLPMPTPSPNQIAFQELDELLARQAQAMLTGDLEAYLATFAPDLRAEQETIFRRGRLMPFTDYGLAVSPAANLSSSGLESGRLPRVPVQTHYRLRGTPEDNPFRRETQYDFERQDGNWIISGYTLTEYPPFWWTGDVVVRETPHFLLIARPEMSAELDQLAQECEQAYSELLALGFEMEPRFVAYFTETQADFNAQTGQGSRVLGVALSFYDLSGEQIDAIGRAFYINGQAFQEQADETGPFGRLATTRHELIHLVLAKDTRPFTPPWLIEGAAVYYAGQNIPELRRLLVEEGNLDAISLAQLTGAGTLGAHDFLGQRVGREYIYSAEVARYLIETYGEETFLELYRFYNRLPAAGVRDRMPRHFAVSYSVNAAFSNLSQELTAAALDEIYGLTVEQLDTAVKEWLRQ
jgi:hypothetical protein